MGLSLSTLGNGPTAVSTPHEPPPGCHVTTGNVVAYLSRGDESVKKYAGNEQCLGEEDAYA